jgi:hypothetical protein
VGEAAEREVVGVGEGRKAGTEYVVVGAYEGICAG